LHAGESTEVIGVPVGMPCEVGISEYDDPPPGWRWDWEMDSLTTGVPRVMPASAVETPLDVRAQIWIEEMAGDLSLRIVVDNQAGIAFTDEFTGTWTCDLAGEKMSGTWEQSADEGIVVIASHVPWESTCSVTQDDPPAPDGGSWATSGTVDGVEVDSERSPRITITNTLTAALADSGGAPAWPVAAGGIGLLGVGCLILLLRLAGRRRVTADAQGRADHA
ncbi:MAG: DUF5979 domain-containing protein, partial [Microbacterium sp.]